ncbi:hypothetical protein OF83DRAFT_1097304 [Amylostereum chailletii]|nr:hypothetical protein OF83DRAFT_1097304 [Amylostereum chailletii]
MLKIWKQAWKKGDQADQAVRQGSDPDAQVGEDGIHDGLQVSVDATSPVNGDGASAGDSSSAFPFRQKRMQSLISTSAEDSSEHPRKRYKSAATRISAFDSASSPASPTEVVIFFERLARLPLTALYKRLHQVDKEETHLHRYFSAARHVLVEVGSCASDLIWRRALGDIESSLSPIDEDDEDDHTNPGVVERAIKLEVANVIKHWDFSMPNLDPSSRGFNVTPKFLKLVQVLKSCQPYGDSFRGVIFVRKRAVAQEMVDLIRTVEELEHLNPQILVGSQLDPRTQLDLFSAFEIGTYNLIIATKQAEDLDLPPATVVIRYDLFDSQISYGYARARTAGGKGHLIHMVPRGSDVHRRRLSQVTEVKGHVGKWLGTLNSSSKGRVPPVTIHETHDPYISDSEDEDEPGSYITDPTTSGRIRLQNATGIVLQFASRLPNSDGHDLFDFHVIKGEEDYHEPQYVCTVTLPTGQPLPSITSLPSLTKSHARRTACFRLCQELFHRGLLPYHLFPRPKDSAAPRRHATNETGFLDPDDADTVTNTLPPKGTGQNNTNGTRCYPRKNPEFFTNALQAPSERLYPTVICVNTEGGFAPMLILARLPLPSLSPFNLFDSGAPLAVHLYRAAALEVDQHQLYLLYRYTTRICRAIQNKPYACPLEKMVYFFAPLRRSTRWETRTGVLEEEQWNLPEVSADIPWDTVELAADKYMTELHTESIQALTEDMQDALIQDRWVEFTRRYYVVGLRVDLTPLSKPEANSRESAYENYIEYCKEHRHNFEDLKSTDQPLIEVDRAMPVQNHLHPASKHLPQSIKKPAKYLIPELCVKSTISASTHKTALLLPSITRVIEDLLLVKELNATLFDNCIDEHQLHAAISAPSAGVEFDYERLELFGDAYLKYLSSVYLFVTNPSQHEGALHSARLRIISNKALLLNADSAGLPPFIQAKPFVAKVWQPPNFVVAPPPPSVKPPPDASEEGTPDSKDSDVLMIETSAEPNADKPSGMDNPGQSTREASAVRDSLPQPVPEQNGAVKEEVKEGAANDEGEGSRKKRSKRKKATDERNVQWLGDKAVADVAEAIIGAAFITGGREIALTASKALCIAVPRVDRWSDFGKKALAPPPDVTARLRPGTVESIEVILGHKFARPHLLAQALTHASIQGYEMTCYERLEFLGDAILDFLVIRHIYDRDTKLSPGALTLLKGSMVSNAALAAVCISSGLYKYLMFDSQSLATNIESYAVRLEERRRVEYELAAQEGRPPGQYWLDAEAPKAISDVVESIIGAIYISDNFSPEGVITFYNKVLMPFYDAHITLKTLAHHPTKILFELFQAQGCQSFEMVRTHEGKNVLKTQCDVIIHDIVLASATDATSAQAAKQASLFALDALEGDPGFMTRTCDCRAQTQARKAQKKGAEQDMRGFAEEEEPAVAGAGTPGAAASSSENTGG